MQPTVLELIERALSGVDISESEFSDADWDALSCETRQDAWSTLQHWMHDGDARVRDTAYAALQAAGMRRAMQRIIFEAC